MENKTNKCPHCHKVFKDAQRFSLHNFSFGTAQQDVCKVCKVTVPSCITLSQHLESHYSCPICLAYFFTESKLMLHRVQKHFESIPPRLCVGSSRGTYKCIVCNMSFPEAALAEIHIKNFHAVIRMILKVCNRATGNSNIIK